MCILRSKVNIGRVDVVEVSGSSITVASRKDLQLERYEAAAAAAAAANDGSGSNACDDSHTHASSGSSIILWRLDQDEAASIGMHQRAAVLRLAADTTGSNVPRLRELIIDLDAPRLRDVSQETTAGSPTNKDDATATAGAAAAGGRAASPADANTSNAAAAAPETTTTKSQQAAGGLQASSSSLEPQGAARRLAAASGESYLRRAGSHLNSNQVAVLRRVMAMQDYCLVLGMPGESLIRVLLLLAACDGVRRA